MYRSSMFSLGRPGKTVTGAFFPMFESRRPWSWPVKLDFTSSRATAAGDLQQFPIPEANSSGPLAERRSGSGHSNDEVNWNRVGFSHSVSGSATRSECGNGKQVRWCCWQVLWKRLGSDAFWQLQRREEKCEDQFRLRLDVENRNRYFVL